MSWPRYKQHFSANQLDGRYRDILIDSPDCWEPVLRLVRSEGDRVRYEVDGEETDFPTHVQDIFLTRESSQARLDWQFQGIGLFADFMSNDEVELHFDIKDFGESHFTALVSFVKALARATGQVVTVCHDMSPDKVILSMTSEDS